MGSKLEKQHEYGYIIMMNPDSSDSSSSNAGSIDARTTSNVADRNNMVRSLFDRYDVYRFMPMHEYNPVYFTEMYDIRLNDDDLIFMSSTLQSF